MKKLQNNFTTPEQSKWLLELGVPADSADCFWFDEKEIFFLQDKLYSDEAKEGELVRAIDYTPCWSVGRLMGIFDICCAISDYNDWCNTRCVPNEYVAYIIGCYERAIDSKMLDFSKLEE